MHFHLHITALFIALFSSTMIASAANVTAVADAADEDNPIDFNVDIRWRRQSHSGKITREFFDGSSTFSAAEVDYARVQNIMDLGLQLGIFHDLELHANIPYVISDEQTWAFDTVNGVSVENTSSVKTNSIDADGKAMTAAKPLFSLPNRLSRSGFLDPSIGFAWDILNSDRDEMPPAQWFPAKTRTSTWMISFDYTMPISRVAQPSRPNANFNTSEILSVGSGVHRLSFATALSKKMGILDPFFEVSLHTPHQLFCCV